MTRITSFSYCDELTNFKNGTIAQVVLVMRSIMFLLAMVIIYLLMASPKGFIGSFSVVFIYLTTLNNIFKKFISCTVIGKF